jgi:hypothetical protein
MVYTNESTVLKFDTSLQGVHTLRVNNPCPTLNPSRLTSAVNLLLEADPFCPEKVGSLVSIRAAQNRLQETNVLFQN